MRITILTIGSRGDVQPYVALGLGLHSAGHSVTLATHLEFESFVRGYGLNFAPLEGNPRAMLESEQGQAWLASGRNPVKFLKYLIELAEPLLGQVFKDSLAACQGSEAVLYSPLAYAGYYIAKKLNVPSFAAYLVPFTRTIAFPSVTSPAGLHLGGVYNWLTHVVGEQVSWQALRPVDAKWLREALQMPPAPFFGPFKRIIEEQEPVLYGYSSQVLPKPPDWGDFLHVTGYWFLPPPLDWQPPADLLAFLAAGPAPVYIGFGSMKRRNPAEATEIALEALACTRQRGVLLTGWGGLASSALPDSVFKLADIPHEWLFPRMAAIVHHGGAGTTGASLRSGQPSILAPFFGDQPFWADRVYRLGVGPKPVPQKKLSAERLSRAIQTAVSDKTMQVQAAALGQRIRAEDGVQTAVNAFERHVRKNPGHRSNQA